ncbi:MAG: bifunctional diguanylate cyclase/phosphodiesterase [Pseudomonadota bacterium]
MRASKLFRNPSANDTTPDAAADAIPDATGERLWRRMRLAMITSAAVLVSMLAAMVFAETQAVARYERHAAIVASLEDTRLLAARLAVEARELRSASTPAQRLMVRGRLGTTGYRFGRLWRENLARLDLEAPDLVALLDNAPHSLRARMAEAERLTQRLADPNQNSSEDSALRQLLRLSERQLPNALAALIARQRTQAERGFALIRHAGLALGALAIVIQALQWQLMFRPLGRAFRARTLALAEAHEQVRRSHLYDALTGLANTRQLIDHLNRRDPEAPLGLLHVDLVDFRDVNAAHGWEAGDAVLRYVARTLADVAAEGDIAARTGPDEFVLATRRRTDPVQLQELSVDIMRTLADPVRGEGFVTRVEVVIGIAAREGRATSVETLLANARDACYRAREESGAVYFSSEMGARLAARRQSAQDLLQALDRDEIEPFFQPQIEARSGRLVGFEALARWRHPERGVLSPFFFSDVAHDPRIGQRITPAIVRRSLSALIAWRNEGFDIPGIGVNVTARELRERTFCDTLLFDLDRVGLAPSDLSIEVLESALVEGADDPLLSAIARLSDAGCRIDLDDFGTGRASLANLRLLQVDRLKIDRSFVSDIHLRPDQRKLAVAMIDLARTLGLRALAEGVETAEEWQAVTELGCHEIQGFAVGRPMPAADVPYWLAEYAKRRPPGQAIAAA